jgi:hypothetical protein
MNKFIYIVSWNVAGERELQMIAFTDLDKAWTFKETLGYAVMDVQSHEVPISEM